MPFRLQVPLPEAVAHRAWRHAHAAVLDAVERGESVALLGAAGTGKTMLLRAVAQALEALGWRVALAGPEGLASVPEDASVVLLDEAGQISADDLAALARPFVLAGPPGLAARLAGLPRPVVQVTLGRMAAEEVARLVPARLAAAGRPPDMFTPEAIGALARHSGGVVRLVLVLAGAALFAAESAGAAQVTREDVDEAAAMRVALAEPEEEAPPAAPPSPPEVPAMASAPPPRQRLAGTGRPRPSRARVWWRRMTLGLAAAGLAMAAGAVVVVPQLVQRRAPPPPAAPLALAPAPPAVVPPPEPPAPEPPSAPEPAPAEPPRMAEAEPPPAVAAPPAPVPVPAAPAPAPAPAPRPPPRPRVAPPPPPPAPVVVVPLPETPVAPSPWSVGRPAPVQEVPARFTRVVTREPANIRRAPGIASPVVRVTSAGMVLRVFEQRGPWVQVGDSAPWGWVHEAVVDRAT